MTPNGSYAGATQPGAAGTPGTPYARNYATQQASTSPGYHTGPYNTGATGATGAPANTGAYGAGGGATGAYPSTSGRGAYPATGGGAPAAYGTPPPNYGAAAGYGTPGGNANYGPPANPYSGGSPVAAYGAPAPQGTAPNSGGAAAYQPNEGYAPAATAGLNREGGYRPGSTGRSVTADGTLRAGPAVQPADYQSGTPASETVPEYTPAPAPPAGYGNGGGSAFIPPGGQ